MRWVLTALPTKIVWNMSRVSGVKPNRDVTQNNPVPTDGTVIGGKKYYTYVLAQDYVFSQIGVVNVPVTIFDPNIEGCGGSLELSLQIEVKPAPVTDFLVNSTYCQGDAVTFTGLSTPYSGATVTSWTYNFGDNTTSNERSPNKFYPVAGTYNVNLKAVSSDGCVGDTTKSVTINARPVPDILQDTIFVCSGSPANFTVRNPATSTQYRSLIPL